MDNRAPIVHKRDFTLRRRLSKCVVCDSAFKNLKSNSPPPLLKFVVFVALLKISNHANGIHYRITYHCNINTK